MHLIDVDPVLCWHCDQSGHTKARCPEYHLQIAMLSLVAPDTPASTVAEVEGLARRLITTALGRGEQLANPPFSGVPGALHLDWPRQLPEPPYPTNGVWHLGVYMGNDG